MVRLMYKKIILLVLIALVTVLVIVTFTNNSQIITVTPWPGTKWDVQLASAIISYFWAGVIFTLAFLADLVTRYVVGTWRLGRERKREKEHSLQIERARELKASGQLSQADSALRNLIKKDPSFTVGRIELALIKVEQGDPVEALEILEEARKAGNRNKELLFLASDLSSHLGNHTTSYDNLKLLIDQDRQNARTLEKLVPSCLSLGKIDEAIEWQKMLLKLSSSATYDKVLEDLAELELEKESSTNSGSDVQSRKERLIELATRYKNSPCILSAAGDVCSETKDGKQAIAFWKRSLYISCDMTCLAKITRLLLLEGDPSIAVRTVEKILEEQKGNPELFLPVNVFLVRFLLHLEMIEKASDAIEQLNKALSETTEVKRQRETALQISVLENMLRAKRNSSPEAMRWLAEFASASSGIPPVSSYSLVSVNSLHPNKEPQSPNAPSPELSTP